MRQISQGWSRRLIVIVLLFFFLSPYSQSQRTEFCPLTSFGLQPNNPAWPQEPGHIAAVNGMLYTTSTQGGTHNQGTIYKISPVGELTVLSSFDGPTTGGGPQGGLTDGKDGYLYGTTYGGGKFGAGTIFRIGYNSTQPEILYHFRNGYTFGYPPPPCSGYPCPGYTPKQRADISPGYPISAPVVIGGTLWGVTTYTNNQNYGAIYSIPTTGGDLNFHISCLFVPPYLKDKDMKQFVCDPTLYGASVLIAGKSGNFYGTTLGGFGSVFEFSGGKVTVLHAFNNTDGNKPVDLMQASDGALYGTTVAGGVANWGTIYRLDPAGGFKVLYEFKASFYPANTPDVPSWAGAPGSAPWAGLVEGRGNFLYGVARYGGHYGRGVIFRLGMNPDHPNYEVLHEFNMADGRSPISTPLFVHYTNAKGEDVTSGDMFGTTYEGGFNPQTKTIADSGVFYRLSVDQPGIIGDAPLPVCAAQPSNSTAPCSFWDDPYVQVRAHVTATQSVQSADPQLPDSTSTLNDAIAVHMSCSDHPHILQFVYREKIINGEHYHGSISSTAGTYLLTIDPANPCWNPDSLVKPIPYYDAGRQARWSCSGLTIFDSPSFEKTTSGDPSTIFIDNKNEIWRTTARDYLICGGQVQKQIQWVVEKKFGGPLTYTSATVQNVGAIPDSFLNLLISDGYSSPFAPKSTQAQKCTQ